MKWQRSAKSRQPNVPAHHHRLLLRLITTPRGKTATACFRSQWSLDYQFATHTYRGYHPVPDTLRNCEHFKF
jgi:hypothetical protein